MTALIVLAVFVGYWVIGYGVAEWAARVQPLLNRRPANTVGGDAGVMFCVMLFWPVAFFWPLWWTVGGNGIVGHLIRAVLFAPRRRIQRIDDQRRRELR